MYSLRIPNALHLFRRYSLTFLSSYVLHRYSLLIPQAFFADILRDSLSIPEVFLNYSLDILEVFLKYSLGIPQLFFKYSLGISYVFRKLFVCIPKVFLDIPKFLCIAYTILTYSLDILRRYSQRFLRYSLSIPQPFLKCS